VATYVAIPAPDLAFSLVSRDSIRDLISHMAAQSPSLHAAGGSNALPLCLPTPEAIADTGTMHRLDPFW
jgi:hypothetical protein